MAGNTFANGVAGAVGVRAADNLFAYNEISAINCDAFSGTVGMYIRWLNNYAHDLQDSPVCHSDIIQASSSPQGFAYNTVEAFFVAGTGDGAGTMGDNEHGFLLQNYEASQCGGVQANCGPFTENVFRRNVLYNLGSGPLGTNSSAFGDSYLRFYHNTIAGSVVRPHYPGTASLCTMAPMVRLHAEQYPRR